MVASTASENRSSMVETSTWAQEREAGVVGSGGVAVVEERDAREHRAAPFEVPLVVADRAAVGAALFVERNGGTADQQGHGERRGKAHRRALSLPWTEPSTGLTTTPCMAREGTAGATT
jgi:hypothetical protein